jgi:1,4-dihydroxy-6-naphthoate synthase
MKIQAAISPCPNDVFIFSGLISREACQLGDPEIDFVFHELETLNLGVQAGRWGLAKLSYANYPLCEGQYSLLTCGGALGRGCGPLLLSNRGAWDPELEVLLPGRFTTANFLFDFFIQGNPSNVEAILDPSILPGLKKVYLPFDELYRRLQGPEPCQGVVIHEMRFTYSADGLALIRDLGEYWEQSTGFPIPLGALAINKRLETEFPGISGQLEAMVRRSLDWAYAHSEQALELCRQYSQALSDSVLRSHIELYVNDFTRNLGTDGEAAVAFFLQRQRNSPHRL